MFPALPMISPKALVAEPKEVSLLAIPTMLLKGVVTSEPELGEEVATALDDAALGASLVVVAGASTAAVVVALTFWAAIIGPTVGAVSTEETTAVAVLWPAAQAAVQSISILSQSRESQWTLQEC